MRPLMMTVAAAALVLSPLAADAATTVKTKKVWVCPKDPKDAAQTGTVLGALGGAVVGGAIAGKDNRLAGAVVGAGVGGLTGHQVAKQNAKKKCHWEYVKVRSE